MNVLNLVLAVFFLIPSENLYDKLILKYSLLYEVDPALIKAIIKVESNFNPYAKSKKGARGLMQLMPYTFKNFSDAKNIFDPENNIKAGILYFRHLLSVFKNIELALAAYNCGEDKIIRNKFRIPPIRETRFYIKKVLSFYKKYKKELLSLYAKDIEAKEISFENPILQHMHLLFWILFYLTIVLILIGYRISRILKKT